MGRGLIKGPSGIRVGDGLEVERLESSRPTELTELYDLAHNFRERRGESLIWVKTLDKKIMFGVEGVQGYCDFDAWDSPKDSLADSSPCRSEAWDKIWALK